MLDFDPEDYNDDNDDGYYDEDEDYDDDNVAYGDADNENSNHMNKKN